MTGSFFTTEPPGKLHGTSLEDVVYLQLPVTAKTKQNKKNPKIRFLKCCQKIEKKMSCRCSDDAASSFVQTGVSGTVDNE